MVNQHVKVDTKGKPVLEAEGNLIYLTCNNEAEKLLEEAKNDGLLNLKVSAEDELGDKLVKDIIKVIAVETLCKRVQREVDIVASIQEFVR